MRETDVAVIGGSAAGITAAKTCRRHYPEKKVLVIRSEEQVPIPCGIPYVFGTVESPQNNIIPDDVLKEGDIDLLVDEVEKVNKEDKTLTTKEEEKITYDKLVLATGSSPVEPPIPGIEKENVFTVKKNVPYLRNISNAIDEAQDLVIIGGGFIGMELGDECRKRKETNVKIVEKLPHCLMLGGFDSEFCEKSEKVISDRGVELLTGNGVESIIGGEKAEGVELENGKEINADAVILAVGSRPNVELAENANLELGANGAVHVDRHLKTTNNDIFACGDCAEKRSFFTGEPTQIMLASIATMEARVAGANLFGMRRENPGQVGIYSTKFGDTAFAVAGLSERAAREKGYNVVSGRFTAPNRHPGGMPGMKKTEVKLTFNRDTEVLIGGQVMGGFSSGELINVVGACIQSRMTANDIATLQMGTHPALTASPVAYQLPNAAEDAIGKMR
ncbi:MAG: FAD-dependent oxidoreductase [Candidatus Hadarchaeota archaeon]